MLRAHEGRGKAKDGSDFQTIEFQFSKTPLQAILNVICLRKYTATQEDLFAQKVEQRAKSEGNLEMMMAIQNWKRCREVYPAGFPRLVVATELAHYHPFCADYANSGSRQGKDAFRYTATSRAVPHILMAASLLSSNHRNTEFLGGDND